MKNAIVFITFLYEFSIHADVDVLGLYTQFIVVFR